jgi:AIG2-like family
MPRPSKLYLAYGSNLHKASMRRRCPDARALGTLMLQDAKLVFRGVADAIYFPGSVVPVGVWRLFAEDERKLDSYEGINSGFYSKETVELDDGNEAFLYVMNSKGIYPPSQYYVDTLRAGYRDFGLDPAYLEIAIKESYLQKQPDRQTIQRRHRQRKSSHQYKLVSMPAKIADKVRRRIAERHAEWQAEIEAMQIEEGQA